MKYFGFLIVFLLIFLMNCFSIDEKEEQLNIQQLFSFNYDRLQNPDPKQLSIIRYILQNTYENNIHRMRGEIENVVYVHADGREAVYDKDGNLVTNSYNKGSFNYGSYDRPIEKFLLDIAPWLILGNTRDDPTSFNERLYYYTLDLDRGIQSYIFEGSKENLEIVSFNELSKNEKEVYYIFLYVLFNRNYLIKLNDENLPELRNNGEYYYNFFYQIQEVLHVKQ